MNRARTVMLALAVVAASSTQLAAQAINNSATGLTGTFTTADFNGLAQGNGSAFTNQVSGLTFSPGVFYCQTICTGASFSAGYLYNFADGVVNPFSILFDAAVSSVAFQIQTNNGVAVNFDFFLAGVNVGSYATTRSCCGQAGDMLWNGWENSAFDRVDILVGSDGLMALDNVQYAATPEPATMTLLGTGLFGLAGAVRRRRQKKA